MFVVRRRFAISRISDNCLAWIRSYRFFDDELFQKSTSRSSRSQIFFKICAPKNFATFTGKHPCWSLQQALSCEICEIFQNPFFYRTPSVAASKLFIIINIIIIIVINPFLASVPILYSLKTLKTPVSLEGMKWGHWPEMSQPLLSKLKVDRLSIVSKFRFWY